MSCMFRDWVEFDTSFGPGWVVYNAPRGYETGRPTVSQVLVKCPEHIVWDDDGYWWPDENVVDEALPAARVVCHLLGIPPYEYLREVRPDSIWAIEKDYEPHVPVSYMMDFIDNEDYDGRYSYRNP